MAEIDVQLKKQAVMKFLVAEGEVRSEVKVRS